MSAKLIYINGHGYSGSTMLDFLLGNHPQITSGGEFHALWKPPSSRKCSCGKPIIKCDYWHSIKLTYLTALNIPEDAFHLHPVDFITPRKHRKLPNLIDILLIFGGPKSFSLLTKYSRFVKKYWQFSQDCWTLYQVINQNQGTSFVVDSSKGSQRLMLLSKTHLNQLKVIHLIRDGRAVLYSALKRGRKDVKEISQRWKSINRHAILSQKRIPETNRIKIRYEDLCENTSKVMNKLFTFLNVEPANNIILGGREHHMIPGNHLLFKLNDKVEYPVQQKEEWKNNLSADTLAKFDDIAGDLNRTFGYS